MGQHNTTVDAVQLAHKQRHLQLLEKVKGGVSLTKPELQELESYEQAGKPGPQKNQRAANSQELRTQKQAARYAKVDERTIRRWAKRGMPRPPDGGYQKWILDFYKQNEGQGPTGDRQRELKAQADLKETKAKLAQIELDIATGKLVAVEQIEQERIRRILVVKRALLGMGRKLAPALAKTKAPQKIKQIIDELVKSIIEGFANRQ